MKFIDQESYHLIKNATLQNKLSDIIYILTLQAQNLKERCVRNEKAEVLVYESLLALLLQVSFFGDEDITPECLEELSKYIARTVQELDYLITPQNKPLKTIKHLSLIVDNTIFKE